MKKMNKFKVLFQSLYLSGFCMLASISETALAAPRDDAKNNIKNEGKAIFLAVTDVVKYLAPFAGALGIVAILMAGTLASDEAEVAKIKKNGKIVVMCLFGITVASWIVSLVSNKSV